MKQIYYHYTQWEDFQAHMYDEDKEDREKRVEFAMECLQDPDMLGHYMRKVVREWKCATEQNFTNQSINHQAYLGQSACCMYAGCHEDETREAWGRLTNEERYRANRVADQVYEEWERQFEKASGNYQISLFDKEEV